jgi:hypothetical protein
VTAAGDGKIEERREATVYQAKHKHFPCGDCKGTIVVTKDALGFESLDDVKRRARRG